MRIDRCPKPTRETGLQADGRVSPQEGFYEVYGRGGEIRTPGLIVPNDARYQTAPHPANLETLILAFLLSLHKKV